MKNIKIISLLTTSTAILYYSVKSFIDWDIGWLLDIKNWDSLERSSLVVSIGVKFWTDYLIYILGLKPYLKKKGYLD